MSLHALHVHLSYFEVCRKLAVGNKRFSKNLIRLFKCIAYAYHSIYTKKIKRDKDYIYFFVPIKRVFKDFTNKKLKVFKAFIKKYGFNKKRIFFVRKQGLWLRFFIHVSFISYIVNSMKKKKSKVLLPLKIFEDTENFIDFIFLYYSSLVWVDKKEKVFLKKIMKDFPELFNKVHYRKNSYKVLRRLNELSKKYDLEIAFINNNRRKSYICKVSSVSSDHTIVNSGVVP